MAQIRRTDQPLQPPDRAVKRDDEAPYPPEVAPADAAPAEADGYQDAGGGSALIAPGNGAPSRPAGAIPAATMTEVQLRQTLTTIAANLFPDDALGTRRNEARRILERAFDHLRGQRFKPERVRQGELPSAADLIASLRHGFREEHGRAADQKNRDIDHLIAPLPGLHRAARRRPGADRPQGTDSARRDPEDEEGGRIRSRAAARGRGPGPARGSELPGRERFLRRGARAALPGLCAGRCRGVDQGTGIRGSRGP